MLPCSIGKPGIDIVGVYFCLYLGEQSFQVKNSSTNIFSATFDNHAGASQSYSARPGILSGQNWVLLDQAGMILFIVKSVEESLLVILALHYL